MIELLLVAAFSVPSSKIVTFTVDRHKREAILYTPTKVAPGAPLVFGWHPHGGTMQIAQNLYKVEASWPEAIVIYPKGENRETPTDSSGTRSGWQSKVGDAGDADLKFFDTMYAELYKKYRIDTKRVYSMGFSNGALFTYVLWHARRSKLASAAAIAGVLGVENQPVSPMSIFVVAGQQDHTAPFDKQLESIKYEKQVLGVPPNARGVLRNGIRFFQGRGEDLAVIIHPGGHEYPQGTTAKIVRFFKNHTQ